MLALRWVWRQAYEAKLREEEAAYDAQQKAERDESVSATPRLHYALVV